MDEQKLPKVHLPTRKEIEDYENVEEKFSREPMRQNLWTPAFTTGVAIIMIGAIILAIRFIWGLGAVTNLSQGYPWGIWIAFDVVVGIALAAGGFVTAAIVYIFNRGQYSPLVRPAIVTALLGYAMAGFAVFIDVGRWWQIYNPILPENWQANSALFEVCLCVMSYLTVLMIEFLPTFTDKFLQEKKHPTLYRLSKKLRPALNKVLILFIIAGIVISMLHQSSLGSIMLLMEHRLHALWFTPWLPLFFLLSAIGAGMHIVIIESIVSARTFGREVELPLLASLARRSMMLLGLFVVLRFWDLLAFDELGLLFSSWYGYLFILEVALFGIIPVFFLSFRMFRNNPNYLFASSVMVVLGLVLNRFNVYMFALDGHAGWTYFPTLWELMISAMMVAIIFVMYKVLANYFPVLTRQGLAKSA